MHWFAFSWVAALGLVGAAYLPALHGGFMFDDVPNIVDNPAVHLESFSLSGLAESLGGVIAGPLGRPVSVWSFALTHLFFGLDPYAFKAINLTIHLLNGLLVGWLVALLLRVLPSQGLSEEARKWLPLWAAAVWLAHPIHFVALMMAVQRMTLLAGTFTLLALIAHLRAWTLPPGTRATWAWLAAGWLVFWPLAFFSKETGLLFPVYAGAIALYSRMPGDSLGRARRKILMISVGAVGLVGLAMLWHIGWTWLEAGYAVRTFTLQERLMTEARVLWFYLGQTLAPSHAGFSLYLDWFPVSTGLLAPPTTLAAILGWGLAAAVAAYAHGRAPMLGFGLVWFLAGHSLESTFIPLEIAHEHRNYLPALGPILALGFFGARVVGRLKLDYPRLIAGALSLAPVLLLALLTWLRATQMSAPLVGSQVEATRHPMSARANYVAAVSLMKAGYGDIGDPIGGSNVRFYLEQAEKSDPSFKLGHLGLVIWSCASGRPVESQWIESFAHQLESTPFGHGQKPLPAYLLAPLVKMPGCLKRQDALRLFSAGARNRLLDGRVRARFLEAASDYELLVSRDPASAKAYLSEAVALSPHDSKLRAKLDGYNTLPPGRGPGSG